MSYHFPPPNEWQVFQSLVAGFAKTLYDAATVEEYGRNGQRQNGVDIFARDHADRKFGLQCKWTATELDENVLTSEATKALKFKNGLDFFVLWTTAPRDVHVQDAARHINDQSAFPFKVSVSFWDDAISHLNRAYTVANDYYASWLNGKQRTVDTDHRIKMAIAVDRPAFTDPIHIERSFGDLLVAVRDTITFLNTGILYDRFDRTMIVQALPFRMLEDPSYVKSLARIHDLLKALEAVLLEEAASFGSVVISSFQAAEECDRLRVSIVRSVADLQD